MAYTGDSAQEEIDAFGELPVEEYGWRPLGEISEGVQKIFVYRIFEDGVYGVRPIDITTKDLVRIIEFSDLERAMALCGLFNQSSDPTLN